MARRLSTPPIASAWISVAFESPAGGAGGYANDKEQSPASSGQSAKEKGRKLWTVIFYNSRSTAANHKRLFTIQKEMLGFLKRTRTTNNKGENKMCCCSNKDNHTASKNLLVSELGQGILKLCVERDLLFLLEQKSTVPAILSSLLNRLPPSTYANLRRTCSYMDNWAEGAIDRKELWILLRNKCVEVELVKSDGEVYFTASYSTHMGGTWPWKGIGYFNSIYGFHYRAITILPVFTELPRFREEKLDLDTDIIGMLSTLRYDWLVIRTFHDPSAFLRLISVVTGYSLNIINNFGPTVGVRFLKSPEFEKFSRLSITNSSQVHDFYPMELCKQRRYLQLIFKEDWDDAGAHAQFIEDIYNAVDIGLLKHFSFGIQPPPSGANGLPNGQLGSVTFTLLKEETKCLEDCFTITYVYFCQTKTRKLALSLFNNRPTCIVSRSSLV